VSSPSPTLARLRARISALEGPAGEGGGKVLPLGVAALDAALPGGGISLAALHEIAPAAQSDGVAHGAALGFAAWWLGRLAASQGKPVLWVTASPDLYAPGLALLGLTAGRLLVVRPRHVQQALWAMEEGLHCRALAAVLGEVSGADFTVARRLSLAARARGVTALLLNGGAAAAPAVTRWRVGPAASREGAGGWRWQVELCRCRGRGLAPEGEGAATRWLLEWNNETHCLGVAALPGDRPAMPQRRVG
jgi:protein ImuA